MKPTILVVEDDPLAAKILEAQLRHDGYHVSVAYNGLQALKMCREEPPDLVLLDLMLPGVDGFEVLSQMRAEPGTARVPVIVVSAKTDVSDQHMAARLGANRYLTKPYSWSELSETVRSLLRQAPAQQVAAGKAVLMVGARGAESAAVGTGLGLALAQRGEATILADLRPFSVEHFLLLEVPPPSEPIVLSGAAVAPSLAAVLVRHPSALRLLGNLQGRGVAGELLPEDVWLTLEGLLREGGIVLADLPLHPVELLRRAAERTELTLLVLRDDAPSLAAARSALRLMGQAGINLERVHLVLVGPHPGSAPMGLDQPVLGTVPETALAAGEAYEMLAERLVTLLGPSGQERTDDDG